MNDIQVREALFEIFPPDGGADWDDVVARSSRSGAPFRRLTLVLALLVLVTLAVGSALALSGRLGNLFRGSAVKDVTPRERFLMSEFDLNGKVELIARRNGLAFYVIRRKGGRRCYAIDVARSRLTPAQRAGQFRFGGAECLDPRVFPSRAMPVLNQSYFSYSKGDREARMVGVRGFAVDAVDRIGVIGRDNQIIFTLPVEHNVYTAGKRGFLGARGVVGLDDKGKVLWVQCYAIGRPGPAQFPSGGCGKYKNTPPPQVRPTKVQRNPVRPPGPLVVQHGSSDGVNVSIEGSRITFDFRSLSPQTRALLVSKDGRITVGCLKLVTVGSYTSPSGAYSTKPFGSVVQIQPYNPFGQRAPAAPFDACTTMGMYGHSWADAHGTHDTIEIALTNRGRRYLAERAVARDIAWLARARAFREIRYGLRKFTSDDAARRLGPHAVPLPTAAATPEAGKLGIWVGPHRRIVLAERAPTGRRLYLELRHGVQYRTNLLGLTQVL